MSNLNLFLYIDPGTGSMLFSLVIGLTAAGIFAFRSLWLKLKFILSAGKTKKGDEDKTIPFVIFCDHKRYWNLFGPICEEFENRGIDLTYYTASPDDPVFSKAFKFVHPEYLGSGNKPYIKMNMLHANMVLSTTPGLGVYQWKRSRYVKYYVHIPHTVDDLAGYRMFGLDHYDAVLTTGQNQIDFIKKIESLRPAITKKELLSVGSPILDSLKLRLKNCVKKENKALVVLIAPSWGKSGILCKYGKELLYALSGTPYEIVVRPHPQTIVSEQDILQPLTKQFPDIIWNYDNDNFDILNKADILITDFSGIIYEYSFVFNKPLIYADTQFDPRPYDAAWVEQPIWCFRVLPKIGIPLIKKDFNHIGKIIKDTVGDSKSQHTRDEVRMECWNPIGNSVQSIVDYALNKEKELSLK